MKKAFVIRTGTCYPHRTDFDLITNYLRENGWILSRKIERADFIIVNTCAMTKKEENIAISYIDRAKKEKKSNAKIVVTGCLPSINPYRLKRVFKGEEVSANSLEDLDKLFNARSRIRSIKYIGSPLNLKNNTYGGYLLRIGWGCDGWCSYCSVKNVFGKPHSRPISEILEEFNNAYEKGYRRFVLVANDCGSYGVDSGNCLINLLKELCSKREGFKLALSHLNPDKLKKILPQLKIFITSGKIWRINIPAESGSDRIIRLMRRRYSIGDFKYCINRLIEYNPQIEILTDIIVGFPSESEKDFLETLKLVDWLARKKVFFQCLSYSPRPNTEASRMPRQIDEETKRRRLRRLLNLCEIGYTLRDKDRFLGLKREKL